ncbi:MAG: NAD(P)-dependent alcohol dehydrogenase [Pseudomonadota bacterium]
MTPDSDMHLMPLELAAPRDDEVLIEISHVGICHTDIGVQQQHPLPAVLGHEGYGTVIQCGDTVSDLTIGDRVVLTFGYCGQCRTCTMAEPAHCQQMPALNFSGLDRAGETTLTTTDGQPVHGSFFYQSSFASHAIAHQNNAVRVARDLPPALMATLGCGVQTGAGAVVNTFAAEPGASLVCVGVGSVGLSAIMAARIARCQWIIAVDPNPQRRQVALEVGATHVFDAADDWVGEVQTISDGGADYCLDTAGLVTTLHAALDCVRPGGHVALATVPHWSEGFHFHPAALAMGRTLTGIVEGSSNPQVFIPQLAQWVANGALPLDTIVTEYPFEAINTALDDLAAGRVIKPVLVL